MDTGECAIKPLAAEIAEGLAEDAEKKLLTAKVAKEGRKRRKGRAVRARWPGKQIPPASAALGVGMTRFAKGDA